MAASETMGLFARRSPCDEAYPRGCGLVEVSVRESRCLGLIGGLGIGATVHYYRALGKAHAARELNMRLLMTHVETNRVFDFMRRDDRQGLAGYLGEAIGRLKAGGAELAAVPAVAPHFCVRELIALSPLPVLNLLDAVADAVRASGIRRAAIFGTRLAMESGVFGALGSVELIRPDPAKRDYIHETYLRLATSGEGSEEDYRGLSALAQALLREGAEAIVLAGTDLSLIFNEQTTGFPHIDCARVHIDAILRAMMDI